MRPLAAVGRMALTNYIFQSLVCTTIFLSYGIGFFGTVGPALGVALTATIFSLQVVVSRWWLSRFHHDPLEWLWRSFTYLRVQPLRKGAR